MIAPIPTDSVTLDLPGRETTELTLVSPALAARWLDDYTYDRQRNISALDIDRLGTYLKSGTFKPGTIELYHAADTARWYLVDGQHRLHAIAATGVGVRMNVWRHWVATKAEVDTAYAAIDRGRPRTYSHIFRALAVAPQHGMAETEARQLGAATVPLLSGFQPPALYPITRVESARLALIDEWAETARALFELYRSGARSRWGRLLLNATPMAVALATLRDAESETHYDRARSFWYAIGAREGLWKGDPRHTLTEWLQERGRWPGSVVETSRLIAAAWNAYAEGRDLQLLKATQQQLERPLLLRGTRYTGKMVLLPHGSGRL
jgi:hypothetical protein